MFKNARIINAHNGLDTVCDARAAERIAEALDGLTEVVYIINGTNDVASTAYYLDRKFVAAVQAGEQWGAGLTALIEAN